MFSTWDFVRPTVWHPMASLEQSLMNMDLLTNTMLAPAFPRPYLMTATILDDDDFFSDLPFGRREQQQQQPNQQESQAQQGTQTQQIQGQQGADQGGFSSYTYSTSSVVDDKGRRVSSSRRRYEDSTGLLKAVYERELDGKKLTTVWNRRKSDEEGEHKTICSSTNPEEFEKMWSDTPFGKAHEKKIKDTQGENQEKPQEKIEQSGAQPQAEMHP